MNNSLKLSKKEESSICLSCGECCKKYWITVLPGEATRIAKLKRESKKNFLENNCILYVKLYPKSTPGTLTYSSVFLPKRIFDLLKKQLPQIPQSFFVLPQVVLRREEKIVFHFSNEEKKSEKRNACMYLSADNKCSIYEERPTPCRLFPFIAVEGFREQYPFCELFQRTSKDFSSKSKAYYKRIQNHFKELHNLGFISVWRNPPKRGLVYLQDTLLGEISLSELEQMIPRTN